MKKFAITRRARFAAAALAGTLAALGSLGPEARAQEYALAGGGNYVGVLLGPAWVSDDVGTKFAVGGDVNVMVAPNIGAGLYVTYNSLGTIAGISTSVVNLLAEGNYFIEQVPGLHLGAKIGVGLTSSGTTITGGGGDSGADLVLGPAAGLDVPLQGGFSVGGEANFLLLTSNNSLTTFNLLAAVKYWF